ncbi:hypothetical protein GF339_07655 [candidate division KSB3 bacterium]|uniref:Uncharacterized protein n=1 Tax=candidate division KSB3 bacterium TaxID=2044937 RepID=A0A9D5JVH8_9BACT|nr:hypothetical protein [candidate division KSB3 bacterium]MBD3324446.1 hypothetical protein [candidate division KSB3 bacterium]
MDTQAIEFYIQALLDITTVLEHHREARTAFDPLFLSRIMRDGFLQTSTAADRDRILHQSTSTEEFLLWRGPARQQKMNWNCLGWIFPFASDEEIERTCELITRSELDAKSWAAVRQFWLSCRLRLQEVSFDVPTNLVKVRVMGSACQTAMQTLETYPPNLRYVAKSLLDQLPATHYFRKRIQMKLVVGETLEPYISTRKGEKKSA